MKLTSIKIALLFILFTSSATPIYSQNIDSLLQSTKEFEEGKMSDAKFIDGIINYWATNIGYDVEERITSVNKAYYYLGYALPRKHEESEKVVIHVGFYVQS